MQPDYEKTAASMVAGTQKAIAAAVAPLLKRIEALEARPAPERGEVGEKGDRGESGIQGRDGVGIAGALIDRSGVLVLTLSDGSTRDLGIVVGKDGRDGEQGPAGESGPQGEPGPQGEKGEAGDNGKDGIDGRDGAKGDQGLSGRDGRDGFDLEDFDIEAGEDGRTATLKFQRGDNVHRYELEFPVMIYRGVWKDGEYRTGDVVTWGGSLWHCDEKTGAKPDSANSGWRLAVKKGRDGKDAAAK